MPSSSQASASLAPGFMTMLGATMYAPPGAQSYLPFMGVPPTAAAAAAAAAAAQQYAAQQQQQQMLQAYHMQLGMQLSMQLSMLQQMRAAGPGGVPAPSMGMSLGMGMWPGAGSVEPRMHGAMAAGGAFPAKSGMPQLMEVADKH